jgi:hypothetical protein
MVRENETETGHPATVDGATPAGPAALTAPAISAIGTSAYGVDTPVPLADPEPEQGIEGSVATEKPAAPEEKESLFGSMSRHASSAIAASYRSLQGASGSLVNKQTREASPPSPALAAAPPLAAAPAAAAAAPVAVPVDTDIGGCGLSYVVVDSPSASEVADADTTEQQSSPELGTETGAGAGTSAGTGERPKKGESMFSSISRHASTAMTTSYRSMQDASAVVSAHSSSALVSFSSINLSVPKMEVPVLHKRPTWNTRFATAVQVLRLAAASAPHNVTALRLMTDHGLCYIYRDMHVLPLSVCVCVCLCV